MILLALKALRDESLGVKKVIIVTLYEDLKYQFLEALLKCVKTPDNNFIVLSTD